MIFLYDPVLVALSIAIAIFGSFTALVTTSGYNGQNGARGLAGCMACYGGLMLGGSIWSMHFIAMLAVQLPVTIEYDLTRTLLSLALAVFLTGLGLRIVSGKTFGRFSLLVAGLITGLGISGMHYLGMDAIRGCGVRNEWQGMLMAVGIAIGAATIALWFVFRRRSMVETLLGSIVLGFASAGMHYTAMIGTSFVPLRTQIELSIPAISQPTLAFIIGATVIVSCIVNNVIAIRTQVKAIARAK